MIDALNFVPLTETITIRGKTLKLSGVDVTELFQLFKRFPELGQMIATKKFDPKAVSKQAMAAVLAAGIGRFEDEEAEKSLAALSLGERVAIFNPVFRLTSPGGVGPFVDLAQTLSGGIAPAAAEPPKKAGVKVRLKP